MILCIWKQDITDRSSFEKVKFWVGELQTHEESACIVLVGTKSINFVAQFFI